MSLLRATLEGGQTIDYLPEIIGEGGMKVVHFTPDRAHVVCFFKDPQTATDPQRRLRLQAIVGKYNPTKDEPHGVYWENLFCWPSAVIVAPQLGIVAPAYAANYFFASGSFAGKEKQAKWFTSPKLRCRSCRFVFGSPALCGGCTTPDSRTPTCPTATS